MKDYQDVVNERYNNEVDDVNSIYSPNHPIGKYTRKIIYKGIDEFLSRCYTDAQTIKNMKLLDVGCGKGEWLTYFVSKGFSSSNVMGIDLSEKRIEKAILQNPGLNFKVSDILSFNLQPSKFDLIVSFDLFSHLTTKEQIIQGLLNVFNHLKNDGVFIWFDIYSKDHFNSKTNTDSWGFSKQQMMSLATEAGFKIISYRTFFKNFFNRYHSIYFADRVSPTALRFLEKVLPGMPGNIMFELKKV